MIESLTFLLENQLNRSFFVPLKGAYVKDVMAAAISVFAFVLNSRIVNEEINDRWSFLWKLSHLEKRKRV